MFMNWCGIKRKRQNFSKLVIGTFSLFLLSQCGGVWESPMEVEECVTDAPWISSTFGDGAGRMFYAKAQEQLHVLDGNGDLRRFALQSRVGCRWALERSATDGGVSFTLGQAAEVDGFLNPRVWDPTGRIWEDGQNWSCPTGGRDFAVLPNGEMVSANGIGVSLWSANPPCRSVGGFTAWAQVEALGAGSSGIWIAERGVDGIARLVHQMPGGTMLTAITLSATPGNQSHFCSASRVRTEAGLVALLDGSCRRMGLFSQDGRILAQANLQNLVEGIPIDLVFQDAGHVLVGTLDGSNYRLWRISLAKLLAEGPYVEN